MRRSWTPRSPRLATTSPRSFRRGSIDAFEALERLIELERARLELGEHPRRFVLVHSWTVFWDAYVLAHLDCSHTTAHSRVRRATVRRVPIDDEATREALVRERRLIRWAARDERASGASTFGPDQAVELADLSDYGGFGDGWAHPDERGIWTQGSRSQLALALDGIGERDHVLALSLGSICVAPDASLRVEALVNGERAAARDFSYGDPEWHIELPARCAGRRRGRPHLRGRRAQLAARARLVVRRAATRHPPPRGDAASGRR